MNIHQIPENSMLGHSTTYPKTYAPDIIYPISRELGRRHLALSADKLSIGADWWHAFEVSWLNPQGISQVAMLRLTIPASSPFIVESKSLKLYLNSLNFTEFTDSQSVIDTIEQDLSSALQTQVGAELITIDDAQSLPLYQPEGLLIDTVLNDSAQKVALTEDVDSRLLAFDTANTLQNSQRQVYHSHLLRSNCPVTNQPDWGTLLIDITSAPIDKGSLLQYILTFRQHNGFHEQCVELIFSDLTLKFAPEKLLVRAWYTRRGGIDINPCRVSDLALLPSPSRVNRQ